MLALCLILIAARPQASVSPARVQAESYIADGDHAYEKGDNEGAIADYTKAIALVPDYAEAWYSRGFAERDGNYDGADADFGRAIELDPDYALAFYNRGWVKALRGDARSAIADYDRALALDAQPGGGRHSAADVLVLNSRGSAHLTLKDNAAAAEDFTRAITLDPLRAESYENRAQARQRLGKLSDAAADYLRAADLRRAANDPAHAAQDEAEAKRLKGI